MSDTHYVCEITQEQKKSLEAALREKGWDFSSAPYADFRASCQRDHVMVIAYTSGKMVIQGRGTSDFVRFFLEPEITKKALFGYTQEEAAGIEVTPHGGTDESGKGDFFGPLIIAAVYADASTAPLLRAAGACDSKTVSGEKQIIRIAEGIRLAIPGQYSVVTLNPPAYNRLYNQIGNLNRLLAWGHARAMENMLELVPDCPRVLSDKFGNERLIRGALMERGRRIQLDQEVRAESDVAVAAASILAREMFLRKMNELSATLGVTLPRGAGPMVKQIGRQLLEKHGPQVFESCAKLHFKTYQELTNGL
ncbi:MAG: ribonuclease HIII [Victivallaceae bacterium]|nr:ribonuclease HIII [Victivallaceae bacterium]